ncbi:MAG: peptidoglycan-binding protein [Bacteroidales bacterium]|nr:peptidoglycan-binding protein [Bacteroidales bacterium]
MRKSRYTKIILIVMIISLSNILISQTSDTRDYKVLQIALKQKNYFTGSIDDIIDSGTKAAITEFQSDKGLIVTGEFDEITIDSLMNDPSQQYPDALAHDLDNLSLFKRTFV